MSKSQLKMNRLKEPGQSQSLKVMLKIDDSGDNQGSSTEYYRWRMEDVQAKPLQRGGGDLQLLSQIIAERHCQVLLLIPGSRALVRTLDVTRREARHLNDLIPYQLEDELAVDTEKMHFAYGQPVYDQDDSATITVIAVEKNWLQRHLSNLAAANIDVTFCAAEPLCLPETNEGWTLRLNDELLVRTGDLGGFSVHLPIAAKALELASKELPEPRVITLLADSESQLQRLMQLVPKSLRSCVESVRSGHEWDFSQSLNNQVNILQGSFARRLPFQHWWRLWRCQLGLGLAVLLLFSGVSLTELYMLQQQQQQLNKKIEVTYRQLMPKGVLIDAEKQLQRQVNLLSESQGVSQLLPMLSQVFPLIAAQESIQLKTLSYRDAENVLRLNIETQSFKSIEVLRGHLERQGLKAKILSANASVQVNNQTAKKDSQGRTHQARLQIYFPQSTEA